MRVIQGVNSAKKKYISAIEVASNIFESSVKTNCVYWVNVEIVEWTTGKYLMSRLYL